MQIFLGIVLSTIAFAPAIFASGVSNDAIATAENGPLHLGITRNELKIYVNSLYNNEPKDLNHFIKMMDRFNIIHLKWLGDNWNARNKFSDIISNPNNFGLNLKSATREVKIDFLKKVIRNNFVKSIQKKPYYQDLFSDTEIFSVVNSIYEELNRYDEFKERIETASFENIQQIAVDFVDLSPSQRIDNELLHKWIKGFYKNDSIEDLKIDLNALVKNHIYEKNRNLGGVEPGFTDVRSYGNFIKEILPSYKIHLLPENIKRVELEWGGGFYFAKSFIEGKNKGYLPAGDDSKGFTGIFATPRAILYEIGAGKELERMELNVTHSDNRDQRTETYAEWAAHGSPDVPAVMVFIADIDDVYTTNHNSSYEVFLPYQNVGNINVLSLRQYESKLNVKQKSSQGQTRLAEEASSRNGIDYKQMLIAGGVTMITMTGIAIVASLLIQPGAKISIPFRSERQHSLRNEL